MEPGFTHNATIPIEELIGAPFSFIIQAWESIQPPPHLDPELLARASAILKAVEEFSGHPRLDQLRNAITTRDEHALGALVELNEHLGRACDGLIERCKQWRRDENWTALRHEAALAARLTAAAGRDGQRAVALILLANAHRALHDNQGTIAAYEAAIEAASVARNEHLLAVANDNLANQLTDLGQFDEALGHYDEALGHERDLSGRLAIRTNRANALTQVGELRSAAHELTEAVSELKEHPGTRGRELAVTCDNAAIPIARLGETTAALQLLEQARTLFEPGDLAGRAINALGRSNVYAIQGDKNAAAKAFVEAHDLMFEDARHRIDPEHYRRGFLEARAARLPDGDDAYRMFVEGLNAKEHDAWQQAFDRLQEARKRAWEAGDLALTLRIDANVAALAYECGQVDQALTIATRVRHDAAEHGLARPELMAVGTLGSLAAAGVDVGERFVPLGAFLSSAVLLEVHSQVVAKAGLKPEEASSETYDPGTVANELAIQAREHHASLLAVRYYREAIDKARAVRAWFLLANRLAGLRSVLSEGGNVQEAETVANELETLLANGVLSDRGQLVAHRSLGFHFADRNRAAAISHLRQGCAILEGLSQRMEPGVGRADVARQVHDIYRILARLLRKVGDDTASFEALQGEKGRRLIDALAALGKVAARVSDAPPKANEVMTLIDRLGGEDPTFLVELAVEEDGLTAYLAGDGIVRAVHVAGDLSNLAALERGDVLEREVHLVDLCLRNSLLNDLAAAVTAAVPKKCRLLLVPDQFLYNLPLHVVPVKGRPWCDHFSIGYLVAAGELRFAPGQRRAVGRSLVAGDSRSDLPHAAAECEDVATLLGTKPVVGPDCTRAAVEEALRAGEFDVVHLALHGRGDGRRGGRASLLLADGKGGTEWVAFDELAALPWRAELVVFSGCSTAVAGPRQGNELVGIARAAAERGAAAVVACLWPVGDEAAKIFMAAFYRELLPRRRSGPVDLRVVLDDARKSLRSKLTVASTVGVRRRDGRTLRPQSMDRVGRPRVDAAVADTLTWAPFILLGDPILGG